MPMKFSARNQLRGTVRSIKLGTVLGEVVIVLPDGQEIVSVITRTSVEELKLKEGDSVAAIVKSTEVMIGKDE